ncbi:MAG: transposase [Gemmatimonadetes bacterium]|nr:transposase [Gemmatimonadota bacterium]
MRPSRFNEDQIRRALQQVSAGTPLAAMCRTLGITPTTFYRWRSRYGAGGLPAPGDLQSLRTENQKLKQVVADFFLEREMLRKSLAKYERDASKARR